MATFLSPAVKPSTRYELPELPDPTELERIADPWRPYRTLACRFLWRSLDATPA